MLRPMLRHAKYSFILFSVFISQSLLAEESISDALNNGSVSLDARYRIETVDQDNALKNATASTIRTRVGYRSGDWNNVSAYIEFEDIHSFIADDYNVPGGSNTQYSVVADPVDTELNQAYLNFKTSGTQVRFGNQRIILDKARFVGNVGWRQNEQTYEGLSVVNTSLNNIKFTYAYLSNVNNIVFKDVNMSNHLLNAEFKELGVGTLSTYAYLLEYDDTGLALLSNQTIGARYSGAIGIGGGGTKLLFAGELAKQSDYADGATIIDSGYSFLQAGVKLKNGISIQAAIETLEGDGATSFQTPLATKHAYNGWADQFLGTPPAGLQDVFITAQGKLGGIKLQAVYHNFTPDSSGGDYGTEIDLLAAKKLNKHYSAGIKLARYSADNFSVDTNKLWVWLGAKF